MARGVGRDTTSCPPPCKGHGGESPTSTDVQSTLDGSNFDITAIPDLPVANSDHCMATGPDGTIYVFGDSPSYAYQLKEGSSTWESLSPMSFARRRAGCGVATNSSGHSFPVVAGGSSDSASVEMYDQVSEEWIELGKEIISLHSIRLI